MRKVALVFVLAVFVPSLVLAWLAVRSLRDQQFILERQQSLLYQGVADAKAKEVQDALAEYQHSFTLQVAKLVGQRNPRDIARSFDDLLRRDWPLAQVGFCVNLAGQIQAPSLYGRTEARQFLSDNGRFLANRESVDVYLNQKQALAGANAANYLNAQPPPSSFAQGDNQSAINQQAVLNQGQLSSTVQPYAQNDVARPPLFNKSQARNVSPQQPVGSFQRGSPAEQAQQEISRTSAAPW